ncbi:MAG: hypothetical protein GF398_19110 [Chitinivibrionales bacterium]|nr:hypothetical protein [Chitinivibrionales bacterium]
MPGIASNTWRPRQLIARFQNFYSMIYQTVGGMAKKPYYNFETVSQMDHDGWGSLAIVVTVSAFIGMALSLQLITELSFMGLKMYTGQVIGTSIISEIGPVIIAIVYAGRVGSGTASEIGSMKLNQQLDALRVYGVDPLKKLVAPRVISAVIILPALTFIGDVSALIGGAYIARFSGNQSPLVYWEQIRLVLHPRWIAPGVIKPIVFGTTISMMACYTGLSATGGAKGLKKATTHAFVNSVILIIVLDFVLTKAILYIMGYLS